jgi:hypothetical protein
VTLKNGVYCNVAPSGIFYLRRCADESCVSVQSGSIGALWRPNSVVRGQKSEFADSFHPEDGADTFFPHSATSQKTTFFSLRT